MQNTYQEKLADLEVNNSKKIKKLEGVLTLKSKVIFNLAVTNQRLLNKF